MKHTVIAMKLYPGLVELNGVQAKLKLPPGCTGILLVFGSKKACRDWFGTDIRTVEIEAEEPEA